MQTTAQKTPEGIWLFKLKKRSDLSAAASKESKLSTLART